MTTIEYGHLYIDGQWAAPASAERIRVTEAATEEHLGSVPAATERDIDAAVGAARKAFDDPEGWATWSPARRGDVLERFAAALEARGAETARRVSVQNGMPLWLAQTSRRASRRCCCVTTPAWSRPARRKCAPGCSARSR